MAAETVTRALVGRTVADVERDLILETLKHCLGNRTHAANILGISIRTLRNKLNEYVVRRRAGAAADAIRARRATANSTRGLAGSVYCFENRYLFYNKAFKYRRDRPAFPW